MTRPDSAGVDAGDTPVILLVDADAAARGRVEAALARRFSPDYRLAAAASAEEALAILERLAAERAHVALVAVDLALPEMDAVDFLERARAIHRHARRALLVAKDQRGTRIPFDSLPAIQHATALGRIDFWVLKGWDSPEELLYPAVQEALTAWTKAVRPRHEVFRVVGEQWSPRSHELRDALSRNTVPFGFYPADSEEGRRLIREHGVDAARLPVVIRNDGSVLHQPTLADVAAAVGVHTRPPAELYDLVILGAGPAGLSAAVYGASEGLRTLVIEPQAIGGQAATSSMIRNYLGFPRGVGGGELAFRAYEQALLFGARFVFMQRATGLAARGDERVVSLADGDEVRARAVIVSAGVEYRRLGIPALDRLVGAGVYYGAAGVEAPALVGQEVYVVGGANSAGQAAVHLAKFASRVTLVIRGESLLDTMSDYLVTQLRNTPNVRIALRTRVVDGRGSGRLETITLALPTGAREEVSAAALFVMIGAEPHTEWLGDAVRRDGRGFILSGGEVPQEAWPLRRRPLPFETSMPGVFAAGDARHGSVKRVAGAVGEGSVTVGSVHQYLAALAAGVAPTC